MLPTLLISDFAGTAMKEEGSVLTAYRIALAGQDIPFTEADLAARRGANKRAVFEELATRVHPPEKVREVAGHALETFEATLKQEYETGEVREVAGAEAAFRQLKEAGVKLALSSGFERIVVDLLVRRLGWGSLFDVVLAGNDAPAGRPAPYLIYRAMMDLSVHDVATVAVVGDTPLDLQAGTNAGAGWVIGVLSGAHGLETLGTTRHTHLLASVASLPALFGCEGA
ncbi:MAG TPA: HAD hydrolase-like protein [Chloroflexota bacterium]|nr:HAD hydrolase-like protein [Chloroflexota bacterium]